MEVDGNGATDDVVDATYFESYESLNVHELMIKDKPRTEAYLKAIESLKEEIKGKVVLDVGCGTGILSLFAARAGAAKVFSVEASSMSEIARVAAQQNGYDDVMTVFPGMMEDITLPEKVDVIVSEWMGFFLVHESMLNSVVYARDRWLKPGGLMLPSSARIFLAPVSMGPYLDDKVNFWKDVYGLDFSHVIPHARSLATEQPEPTITTIKHDQLLAEPLVVKALDLTKVTVDELAAFGAQFSFVITKDDTLHGFCSWFDVTFPKPKTQLAVLLGTAPNDPETHWKQTVIFLPGEFGMTKGEVLPGIVAFAASPANPRHYDLTIELGDGEDSDAE